MYACVTFACGAYGGQTPVSDPSELELQMAGNCHWVLGMEPGSSGRILGAFISSPLSFCNFVDFSDCLDYYYLLFTFTFINIRGLCLYMIDCFLPVLLIFSSQKIYSSGNFMIKTVFLSPLSIAYVCTCAHTCVNNCYMWTDACACQKLTSSLIP